MNKQTDVSDEIGERLNKLESEPIVKPFSCLGIFLTVFALFVSAFILLIIFVLWTFPKGSDFTEHDLKSFKRMNTKLNQMVDDLDNSLGEIDIRMQEIERKNPEKDTDQP